jgi:hypothetical protein
MQNILKKDSACLDSPKTEGAQDLHAPKGRKPDQAPFTRRETRSVTRSKNLKIPTQIELSESDEDNKHPKTLHKVHITTRPYGLAYHGMLSLVRSRGVFR